MGGSHNQFSSLDLKLGNIHFISSLYQIRAFQTKQRLCHIEVSGAVWQALCVSVFNCRLS